VDQGHAAAPQNIQLRAYGLWRHHGEDAHAVHVVGDALAVLDAEAAPTCALGGLEALEQVEKGNGRLGGFGVAVFNVCKNWERRQ
jgi:hypothetical protein